jgi:hypothetical protein
LLLSSSKSSLGVFQLAGHLLHIPTSTWFQNFLSPLPCIKEEAFTPSSPRHHEANQAAHCCARYAVIQNGLFIWEVEPLAFLVHSLAADCNSVVDD